MPIPAEPWKALLASEQLLHGGLFEVALLAISLSSAPIRASTSPSAAAMAHCSGRVEQGRILS